MSVGLPIADASGAISAFVAIAVILLVIGGVIFLIARSSRRAQREYAEAEAAGHHDDATADAADVEPNVGAVGLALVAALLAIVSTFLPALETTAFSSIAKNTMIQSGAGWLVIGCAVGILGAVYRVYSGRTTTWAVFVLGLVILGAAVYEGNRRPDQARKRGELRG